jgi:dolichyl-phosphate-mannose--protein O-mannosyl transferase
MMKANGLMTSHEAASTPLTWIWGKERITLFTGSNYTIVLMANVVSWLWVLAAVFFCFGEAAEKNEYKLLFFVYLANILPFILIPRVFFVYHYFPGLVVGYLLLAGWWKKLGARWIKVGIVTTGISFLVIAPVTYGWTAPMWWLKLIT